MTINKAEVFQTLSSDLSKEAGLALKAFDRSKVARVQAQGHTFNAALACAGVCEVLKLATPKQGQSPKGHAEKKSEVFDLIGSDGATARWLLKVAAKLRASKKTKALVLDTPRLKSKLAEMGIETRMQLDAWAFPKEKVNEFDAIVKFMIDNEFADDQVTAIAKVSSDECQEAFVRAYTVRAAKDAEKAAKAEASAAKADARREAKAFKALEAKLAKAEAALVAAKAA